MQIDIQIGKETAVIRGNDDGTVDLCHWVDMKHGDTVTPTLIPYKFFVSLSSCLHRVIEMKVARKNISTLSEVISAIQEERQWLKKMFEVQNG